MSKKQEKQALIRDGLLFVAVVSLLWVFVTRFWSILFPFALALILAYLMNPLVALMHRRFGLNRLRAILVLYMGFFLGLGLGFYFLLPAIVHEVMSMQKELPDYFQIMQIYLDKVLSSVRAVVPIGDLDNLDVIGKVTAKVQTYVLGMLKNIPAILQSLMSFMMIVILVPFISFFLLKDGPRARFFIYRLVPNRYYEVVRNLAYRMDQQLGNYIRGQVLDAFIIGVLSTIGLWLLGIKYFFIIGMLAGVANLIPYFGPAMGAMPAIVVSMIDGIFSFQTVGLIILMFGAVQMIDNLLVQPLVVGSSVNLHPLVVMLAIMIGGSFGGLFAMLLAVPFVSVLRIVIIELHSEFRFRKFMNLNQSG